MHLIQYTHNILFTKEHIDCIKLQAGTAPGQHGMCLVQALRRASVLSDLRAKRSKSLVPLGVDNSESVPEQALPCRPEYSKQKLNNKA